MPKLNMVRLKPDLKTVYENAPVHELHVQALTPVFLTVTKPNELLSEEADNRTTVGADNKIYTPEVKDDFLAHYLLARG